MKILMVCLGNICRSPLAEGILQHKLADSNREYFIDSAGTGAWHAGDCADARSIAIAKKRGVDISHQRARQFKTEDFRNFDYIFVMDRSNYRDVVSLTSDENEKAKVSLLLEFAGLTEPLDVPDPYYGDQKGFESVYDLLDSACNAVKIKLEAR